jgi:hypothetical protein
VSFSGQIYFNSFRNQRGAIDIVQRSNNHSAMLQRGKTMTLRARAQEKVERAGISNYSFDQDVLVMCGVRYTIAACECGEPECDGVRLEKDAAVASRILQ